MVFIGWGLGREVFYFCKVLTSSLPFCYPSVTLHFYMLVPVMKLPLSFVVPGSCNETSIVFSRKCSRADIYNMSVGNLKMGE